MKSARGWAPVGTVLLVLGMTCGNSLAAGPWPEEIGAWTSQEKETQRAAGRQLQADLAAALKRGEQQFAIPPGNYRFAAGFLPDGWYALVLAKLQGFTLDGRGANFFVEWRPDGHSLGAILVQDCTEITIRGVTIDWDPVPFTQGKIVRTFPDQGEFLWKPDPGYETIPPSMKCPHAEQNPLGGGLRSYLYDPGTRRLLPYQVRMSLKTPGQPASYNHPEADGSYRLGTGRPNGTKSYTPEQMGLGVGATVLSHHRGSGTAFWIWNSTRVTVEDVLVYSSPNMIVKAKHGGGQHVFRRLQALRRPGTDRLAVSNADGFQISHLRRGPVIEDCRLEGIGDDFINIGDIADDDAHSGGIVRGNDFQVGAARGVLARASNLLIENNRILNTLEAGIAMTESGAIQHVTIRGNHVEDTCLRSISGVGLCPYTTTAAVEMWGRDPATDPLKSEILIEGNTIVRPSGSAVTVINARNVIVRGNTFQECGSRPWHGKGRQPEQYGLPVAIYSGAEAVTVTDNKVIATGLYALEQ